MKDDLLKILEETNQNRIDVKAALKQVIDLLIHSGINCCKKCKNPIAIGHRFLMENADNLITAISEINPNLNNC